MFSRFSPIFKNSQKLMTKSTLVSSQKSYATYHIDKPTVKNNSHEQTQSNPILKTKKGTVFQHPGIGKDICEAEDCKDKLCDKPCENIVERTTVGHGTHDGSRQDSTFISSTDFAGEPRAQYMRSYNPPVQNHDSEGKNIDIEKTKELNNNPDMQDNIHMNSSRLPTKPENTGSDDPQNIN
jgi:hypothetical protein